MADVWQGATMIPLLPCADIDRTAELWTSLGLAVIYRQQRPNPYVALKRGGFEVHYYGLPALDPDANHGTCSVVVDETEVVHAAFVAGLRALYGRVPLSGLPRMTRPRTRANNAGLSGFSLVDLDGNWIRVTRRPPAGREPQAVDDRVAWSSGGGGPLARALENAVVLADSHGDVPQALRVLSGAIHRAQSARAGASAQGARAGKPAEGPPVSELAEALAYQAELAARLGDRAAVTQVVAQLRGLADAADPGDDAAAVARALTACAALDL